MKLIRKLSKSEQKLRKLYLDMGRKFDAYAWPGGYPIIYVCATGDILCATCATKAMQKETCREARMGYLPEAYDVFYEGPDEICADCNQAIESAYGDPAEL